MARAVMTEQAALDAVRTVNKSETGEDELASLRARAARWTACVGHVITPPSLRLVAGLLASSAVSHEVLVRVLRRAGNDATSILMQHLTAATSLLARRVLFDVIIELGVGVPVLVAHLQHRLWFVVRNAACLLGALRAPEAETALVAALSHADERVRTAAATALMQLATPSARRALEGAIRDSSSDVRRRALRGLLHGDGQSRSAAVLSEAVDLERDEDVQLEVVSALRELATSFAAQQLSRLCSPSVTAGKSVAFRRAALEALVAVRPTAALPLLRLQSKDRDADVRAFATELLARVSRAA
jgi:HEAT repeat protein